jgi:4-hydroxy-4-methyl-2-oxoglutarate aldolase
MTIDADTLAAARTVRTSDLSDALDSMGLQERYVMDPRMRPLFPGIRFAGIARTMAYEPIDRPLEPMTYEGFADRQYAPGPEGLWREAGPYGAPDEVLVIDAKGTIAGILGSNNTLQARVKGTVGFVIDGVCRDSYEATIQDTPLFCTVRSPAHPMGRLRVVSDDEPIECAGVEVRPGDLVVADDDGVVVVPQDLAAEVVDRAVRIQDADRPGRRDGYERLGLPFDETVAESRPGDRRPA